MFSFISAVPVELAVFEGEINNRIEKRERTAIDLIVDKAVLIETKRFDDEIAALEVQLGRDVSATSSTAAADVDNFEKDRARERQQILEAQVVKRNQLTQVLAAKSQQVALEAAGKGPSGKYGNGPALKAMREQEAVERQALTSFETDATAQLAVFDKDTQERLMGLRATRDSVVQVGQEGIAKELDQKRDAKRTKIDEIRLMAIEDRPRLAGLYGESWEEARGFLARYTILDEMSEESAAVRIIKWGCMLLMVLPTLLILGIKLFPSEELVRYYSLGAQAKAGNKDAQKVLENMGYTNFATYGLTDKARDLLADLYAARTELWMVTQQLEQTLQKLCEPDKVTGVHRSLIYIEGLLHAEWLKSEDTVKKVNLLENRVLLTGVLVPDWETDQFGPDPRAEVSAWKVSADRAETYGWHAPDEVLQKGLEAREELALQQRQLRRLLGVADRDLHTQISINARALKRDLEAGRRQFFNEQLVPVLEQIEACEALIQATGQPLPKWPEGFEDPRKDLFKNFCRLEDRILQDRYGWKDARGRAVAASAAVTPPAPVVTPVPSSDGTSNTTQPYTTVVPPAPSDPGSDLEPEDVTEVVEGDDTPPPPPRPATSNSAFDADTWFKKDGDDPA